MHRKLKHLSHKFSIIYIITNSLFKISSNSKFFSLFPLYSCIFGMQTHSVGIHLKEFLGCFDKKLSMGISFNGNPIIILKNSICTGRKFILLTTFKFEVFSSKPI